MAWLHQLSSGFSFDGMIQFRMKRWRSLTIALIVVALVSFGVRHVLEKRAEQKREMSYQLALRSYSERFKPGMTRKDVEDYFRVRNVAFQQMCCVDFKLSKRVWDDLTAIGQESAPWFCSKHNVYIAFQFTGPERRGGEFWSSDPSDTLKGVSIFHRLEGCL